MISLRDMAFEYPDSDFSLRAGALDIDVGQRAAVIGPSGSGKTTLLHIVAGILTPTAGSVRVSGAEISRRSDPERRSYRIANIGLIFQEFELLEYLTVRQNILLPYRINPALKLNGAARASADALAQSMGISEVLDRHPDRMSQGQRQRVAICRAMVTDPKIILADEPTGNLDPQTSRTIVQVLLDQATAREATVLMVTHDHSLLDRFDRVIDMEDMQ
ncbi:MAG: ABC transporter ATP-binding protein [Phycisphaerae bacterium]|jgi:putative ABC transport system ATP-binding protein|nr:ABC transporter ATP-binding protein [Phycisphaerae bacterium]